MTLWTAALLILIPLLVWRIYTRVKNMMGRQPSIVTRHWMGVLGFAAVIVVVATEVYAQQMLLACWAVGVAFGIGWGVFGARRTRMERTEQGFFFRPYARLGILFALLMAARVLYIAMDIYANGTPTERFTDSPWTVLALTLMSGYFGTISAFLLRWRLR